VLERLIDLLVEMGRRYDSVGDDLILVELGLMGVMVIKVEVGNNNFSINDINKFITNSTNNTSIISKSHHLQTNTYLTRIKKTLLTQSNKSYLHLGK